MSRVLTDDEIAAQLSDLPGWERTTSGDSAAIAATFELGDFADSLDFVNQVGHEAEQMDHHPDIDIRWNKVTLTLATHSEGGVTDLDFGLARRVSEVTGLGGQSAQ